MGINVPSTKGPGNSTLSIESAGVLAVMETFNAVVVNDWKQDAYTHSGKYRNPESRLL